MEPRSRRPVLNWRPPVDEVLERQRRFLMQVRSGDDAVRGGDDIDEILSRASPNLERIGCPPRDKVIRLARRAQPLGDPAYEHLVKCPPCYREFRAMQEKRSVRRIAGATSSWSRWMAAAAIRTYPAAAL